MVVGGWLVQDEVRFRAIKIRLFLMVVLTMLLVWCHIISMLFKAYLDTQQQHKLGKNHE